MEILSDSWTLIIATEAEQFPIMLLVFLAISADVLRDLSGEGFTPEFAKKAAGSAEKIDPINEHRFPSALGNPQIGNRPYAPR